MKLGILNFQYSNYNYGAVLQAAALEYVINNVSGERYNIEHVDFNPKSGYKYELKTIIKKALIKFGLIENRLGVEMIPHHGNFENFRVNWLKRSKRVNNLDDFSKLLKTYDTLVVGSDQVWRPEYTSKHMLAYFFDGAPKSSKKIAYAASFGQDHFSLSKANSDFEKVNDLINNFNHVSVREAHGVDICKSSFNVHAEHVLDPTLVAGAEYFQKIANQCKGHTSDLVYYKLDMTTVFKNSVNEICNNKSYSQSNIYYDEGGFHEVSYWLKSIKDAKLVITDSFHCVCLSILFNKNFLCINNESRGSSRLESLLDLVDIKDRFITESDLEKFSQGKLNLDDINYDEVNKSLNDLRLESVSFIKRSLI